MSDAKTAMNLRFPDPELRAVIAAAAKQEGVSMQEYILSAAYDRATAVERKFLDGFQTSMARSGAAFAPSPAVWTPVPSTGRPSRKRSRNSESPGARSRCVTQPEPLHPLDVTFLLHAAELLDGDPQVDDLGPLYAAVARVNARAMERDIYGSLYLKAARAAADPGETAVPGTLQRALRLAYDRGLSDPQLA